MTEASKGIRFQMTPLLSFGRSIGLRSGGFTPPSGGMMSLRQPAPSR
jgi:hypothetical protein